MKYVLRFRKAAKPIVYHSNKKLIQDIAADLAHQLIRDYAKYDTTQTTQQLKYREMRERAMFELKLKEIFK